MFEKYKKICKYSIYEVVSDDYGLTIKIPRALAFNGI